MLVPPSDLWSAEESQGWSSKHLDLTSALSTVISWRCQELHKSPKTELWDKIVPQVPCFFFFDALNGRHRDITLQVQSPLFSVGLMLLFMVGLEKAPVSLF